MKLARKTVDKQVFIVTSDAAGPGYSFAENALVALVPPVPAELMPHVARFDGQILGRHVFEIDTAEFERQVADEIRRQSLPAPTPDRTFSRDEIVRDLFRGDEAQFAAAGSVGFPPSSGQRVERNHRIVSLWRARDLDRWREQVIATAAALGR
jgi:hypothetical protein